MDLKYTPEEEAFRAEARRFLEEHVPAEIRDSAESRTTIPRRYRVPYYKALRRKGWMCYKWPAKFGGPGLDLTRQVILQEEMGRIGAPNMDLGVVMAGPMIMEFGTEEQQKRFLPKMVEAEELWCQGYSEPNAGSDLANLAATAVIDGDDFIINGQKIWTSNGHEADWMFILVRTEAGAKKQNGISFVLLDMKTPGIRVAPISQITDSSNFTEVFFQDVRVPVKNLLGKMNDGWTIAKRLLTHERVGVFSGDLVARTLERLLVCAREARAGDRTLAEDPAVRQAFARRFMEVDAARYLGYRNTTRILKGESPGPESSAIKLFASETFQRVCDLGLEVLGPVGTAWNDRRFGEFEGNFSQVATYSRSFSIAGGTSEIQRNIISEVVLGMPR